MGCTQDIRLNIIRTRIITFAMIVIRSLIIGLIGGRKMNNKGMTGVELLAILVIVMIIFLILASFLGKEPPQDYKLEECMRRYNDFDYCKYTLGIE